MTADAAVELAAAARLLALAFGRPGEDDLAEMAVLARGLRGRPGAFTDELDELLTHLAAPDVCSRLAGEHEALFDGDAACPPYEGSYESDPFRQGRQMADVAGFYRAFGAEPAGDRPDHVSCELEFLAYLVAGRVAAEEQGSQEHAATCLAAEDAFLQDHLGRWFPPFCRSVAEVSASPLLRCAARLGAKTLDDELARRGLVPRPLARRCRLAVEQDSLECGGLTATSARAPNADGRSLSPQSVPAGLG